MGQNYVIVRAPRQSWIERNRKLLSAIGLTIVFITFVIQQKYVERHRERAEVLRIAALDLSARLTAEKSYRQTATLLRLSPNRSPFRIDIRLLSPEKQQESQREQLNIADALAQDDHDLDGYVALYSSFLPQADKETFNGVQTKLAQLRLDLDRLEQQEDNIFHDHLAGRENNDIYLIEVAACATKLSAVWHTLNDEAADTGRSLTGSLESAEQRYEFWSGIQTLAYGAGWLLSLSVLLFGEKSDLSVGVGA